MGRWRSPVRNRDKNRWDALIRRARPKRGSQEVCAMEGEQKYEISADGEIVKVLPHGYEHTGMYVVD